MQNGMALTLQNMEQELEEASMNQVREAIPGGRGSTRVGAYFLQGARAEAALPRQVSRAISPPHFSGSF